jgi:hypothetical protein
VGNRKGIPLNKAIISPIKNCYTYKGHYYSQEKSLKKPCTTASVWTPSLSLLTQEAEKLPESP